MQIVRLSIPLRQPFKPFHGWIATITTAILPFSSNDMPYITAQNSIRRNFETYISCLQLCANIKQLNQTHAQLIINGYKDNTFSNAKLLNMYMLHGSLEIVRLVFDKIENPDTSIWNIMLRAYANNGYYKEVLNHYYLMRDRGLQPSKFTFPCVLKACAALSALQQGREIQDDVVRSGFESDVFVCSALVTMYGKCGCLHDARDVFDKMSERHVVAWNAMIAGYVQNEQCCEALQIFSEMQLAGGLADPFTAAIILSAVAQMEVLERTKETHAFVVRRGFESDVFVGTALVDAYGKCGNVEIARQVFDNMPQRNLISWNAMIAGYARNGNLCEVLELFRKLEGCRMNPNLATISTVLLASSHVAALKSGREIHSYIIKRGFESDVSVGSALVSMYSKCSCVEDAYKVFDNMSLGEVASWNSMITGYVQNGYFDEALNLSTKMKNLCLKFDSITISSVLSACAHLGALFQAKEIHNYIRRNGFEANVHVGSALVTMYAKCDRIEEAHYVFNSIDKKDVVLWSGIISGFAQCKHPKKALKCFQEMVFTGLKPDSDTIASVLSACAQSTALKQGKEIHNYITRNQITLDVFVGSALVDMYAKCGIVELAQRVFGSMPYRNVVSWNAMIAGYSQNGHMEEAWQCFCELQLTEGKCDSVTMVEILPVCTFLAALQQGKEIHAYTYRRGFLSDVFVGHALIDMYAKCGSINYARQVFDRMPLADTVVWNIMIAAYGMHGYAQEALTLFHQMQHSGILPDQITFITILSSCSHAGLVDKGYEYFNCMTKDYHLLPRMEHFVCMVDLLGRAGFLDDAYGFIQNMPFKADAGVWGALLGACRIHCNVELGELAAKQLFELDPEHTGYYVLLSNIYSRAGRWDDAARLRIMMKDKGLKKSPGWSWIKVKNKVHLFIIGDRSHPESEKIYAKLKSLHDQMRDAGYVPDTSFVLHNVEE